MKPEKPANKIAKLGEFNNCEGYRTICECTSENHSVDTWIEVGGMFEDSIDDISITFYVNTYNHPFSEGFWQRVKNAGWLILGVDQRQHEVILTKQQALNWAKAVENTIKRLEKK